MPQIFISYSRVDSAFVDVLIRRMQQAFPDVMIWHDESPHGLIGGDNWWDEILRAIAESDVFVFVLSNESVKSLYCQAEFTEARRLQKRIVTIQARDRTELTDALDDIQFIDMKHGPDSPEALPRLFAALTKQLSLARPRRPLWKPATSRPQKDTVPARAANAPETETPPLARPSAEIEALRRSDRGRRRPIIGAGLFAALILAAVVVPLLDPTRVNTVTAPTASDAQTPTQTAESPLLVALNTARTFEGTNADWQALYPDGFQHRFEDGVPMVLVPVGSFTIGANPQYPDEENGDPIEFVEPFWIDLTEVTQGDFERLGGTKANPHGFEGLQRPVESINWAEATAFCALRGARLATEAEWEYAARGPDEWTYPWGNVWDERNTVWNRSFEQGTADVGSFPAGRSWVGAFDLSGNVWEWVSSVYADYPYDESHEDDTDSDASRIVRGGSYDSDSIDNHRSGNRVGVSATSRYDDNGFRCVRSDSV